MNLNSNSLNFKYTNDKMENIISSLPDFVETKNLEDFWSVTLDPNKITNETINSDCRIAAMLLHKFWYNDDDPFIVPNTFNYVEILIPNYCFYLTLDIPQEYRKYNLQRVLQDNQGQWIVLNPNDNLYYGLTSEGLLKLNENDWKEKYFNNVKKKITQLKKNIKNDIKLSILDIIVLKKKVAIVKLFSKKDMQLF